MPGRPRVLIIGDSISIAYTPHVAQVLAQRAEVLHNPGNGGDSENVAANLDSWLAQLPAEVIHFNCGLHDIKFHRDPRHIQVPLGRYRENLIRIVARLKQSGAAVIWANTTPVVESRHTAVKEFDRYNRDVQVYNAAAAAIVAQAGMAIDDLHAVVTGAGPERLIGPDGVHMTEEGSVLLGRMVAARVGECL